MSTRQAKVVFLGDAGVGKTSIVRRFVSDRFEKYSEPTIGAAFMSKNMPVGDGAVKFQLWDTAGQEKYHSLVPMYYRGATAAVIVYDITRPESFDILKHWLDELHSNGPEKIITILAGNKCDCENKRKVDSGEAAKFAEDSHAEFFEVSAKNDVRINDIFKAIADQLPTEELNEDTADSDLAELEGGRDGKDKGSKSKCC